MPEAPDLFKTFNTTKQELEKEIDSINEKSQISTAKGKLNQLSTLIQHNVPSITSHDLKYYSTEISHLEELLEGKSTFFQKKFSFKNRNLKKAIVKKEIPVLNASNSDHNDNPLINSSKVAQDTQLPRNRIVEDQTKQYIHIDNPSGHLVIRNISHSVIKVTTTITTTTATTGNAITSLSSVHVQNCHDILMLLEIEGPVMMHDVDRFVAAGRCHQLRMHDSQSGWVSMAVESKEMIIEGCRGLTIGKRSSEALKVNDFDNPGNLSTMMNYDLVIDSSKETRTIEWLRSPEREVFENNSAIKQEIGQRLQEILDK
ncbi:hypothetical protein DASC09_060300 [Saccharomycopsis crataegensis]|uniref:Tubulin binding cofactor C-like domain-containing protein n=1 Tax=Saccharomycopsis crataegensis TaxID=43959 RepID=A0AAV5QW20_9ASCO|nr:hypothetical protein DASC09_060300 [Saccharomycopsis crataegensis]